MRRKLLLLLIAPLALAFAACGNATDTVQGGQALIADPCAGGGHRWQDLYACFFGPTGKASCGGQGVCHGAPGDQGAQLGAFQCGTSRDCWVSSTAFLSPDPTKILRSNTNGDDPTPPNQPKMPCVYQAGGISRKTLCGKPNGIAYTFTPDDLARIAAWIQAGAMND
jgi:hypothetical protein